MSPHPLSVSYIFLHSFPHFFNWTWVQTPPLVSPMTLGSHFPGVARLPKTSLRLDEDSRNSAKLLHSRCSLLQWKCADYNQQREEVHGTGSRRDQEWASSCLFQWSCVDSTSFSQRWCVTTCMGYCQLGRLTWALVSRGFHGVQSHRRDSLPAWLTLVSSASRG